MSGRISYGVVWEGGTVWGVIDLFPLYLPNLSDYVYFALFLRIEASLDRGKSIIFLFVFDFL